MTTGKIKALTVRTFVGKVVSLLFNILSRFGVVFLLSKNRFRLGTAKPEVVRSAPPPTYGGRVKTCIEKRRKGSKGII